MTQGPLAALDAIEQATGEREVIGDRLLHRRHAAGGDARPTWRRRGDERITACTFFTAPGRLLGAGRARRVHRRGPARQRSRSMMDARRAISTAATMATTFNMLRSNDLIWSFVVNNYLLGKDPLPVRPAVLELRHHAHAGGDAQLLPAQHVPEQPAGGAGRADHRRRADRPAQDHDRRSTCRPARRTTSRRRSRSTRRRSIYARPGALHAGGLGPHRRRGQPAARPRSTSTGLNETARTRRRSTNGSRTPRSIPGSWWPTGTSGCRRSPARKVPARVPGEGGLPAIEDAPGSYVKVRTSNRRRCDAATLGGLGGNDRSDRRRPSASWRRSA